MATAATSPRCIPLGRKRGTMIEKKIRTVISGMPRTTSMNPVAHPMGGGEGRSGGGRHPCSPTGLLAKGGKTRKRKKASDKLIIRRRKKGKR